MALSAIHIRTKKKSCLTTALLKEDYYIDIPPMIMLYVVPGFIMLKRSYS